MTFPCIRQAVLLCVCLVLAACGGRSDGVSPKASQALVGPSLQRALETAQGADQLSVVVTFLGKGAPSAEQLAALESLGLAGRHLRSFPIAGVTATPAQIARIVALPGVRSVYLNEPLQYENDGGTNITGVLKLRDDAAITGANGGLPVTGKGVTVLVNDSGVDGTHEDLKYPDHLIQNVYAGARGAAGTGEEVAEAGIVPIPWQEDVPNTDFSTSHGSHVAGIVGGSGARSEGKYAGVAPGASLIGYGSGAALFVLDALGGFDYAKLNRDRYNIRIVTNSFGNNGDINTPFDPEDPTNLVTQELSEELGVVVVFSAGNSGPGEGTITGNFKKAPWIVLAANGTKGGLLADTSSRGQFQYQSSYKDAARNITYALNDRPTIITPGMNIISVRPASSDPTLPADSTDGIEPEYVPFYTVKSGTSMAAPHAAGIVALMLEANPSLGWRDIKDILQRTATNVSDLADWEGGAGYANAHAAVAMAQGLRRDFAANRLFRGFNSRAQIEVASVESYELMYTPANAEGVATNYAEFEVGPQVTLVVAYGVVPGDPAVGAYPGSTRISLQDPDGKLHSPGLPIPGAYLSGYRVATAPGMPGTWKVLLRGTCGLTLNNPPAGAPSAVSVCTEEVDTNGASAPMSTDPVRVTVKQIETLGFENLGDARNHASRGFIEAAVASRLIDGRAIAGRPFGYQPNATLKRIELAEYLTLSPGLRQTLPLSGTPAFHDVPPASAAYAEAAGAIGGVLRDRNVLASRAAVEAVNDGLFEPEAPVSRAELAYSLVQSLGLQETAEAFTGEVTYLDSDDTRIPVTDLADVPPGQLGYIQYALDLNLIQPTVVASEAGREARFDPARSVTRAEYAVATIHARDAHDARCISGDARPEC
jgi:serine protease AprX